MANHLYRFRGGVLGEHQELEKQVIFCSSLETLNDPMEGFKDLFWSGDKVIWRNLLKHYLLCLDRACIQFMLNGSNAAIDLASIPVFEIDSDLPTQEYKNIFKQACDTFFSAPGVSEVIDALAARTQPVRRDELSLNLRMVHYTALSAIFIAYRDRGGVPDTPGGAQFLAICASLRIKPEIPKLVNELEARHPEIAHGTEHLFATLRSAQVQMDLNAKSTGPIAPVDHNRFLILNEFPGTYVSLLEKIVYGQWYTACFSASYTNSSMWGNYADGHRGVCLKFKTGDGANHELSVLGVTGSRSSRNGGSEPMYGQVKHRLYQVSYQKNYPEIDFFRSLGRLRGKAFNWWYSDDSGNRSVCAQSVDKDLENWRKGYWENFLVGQTTKLEDWKYEEEYRLIVSELVSDLSEPKLRRQKYAFSDLDGIIFGIAMPEADKLEIIDIVRHKCRLEGRTTFEFGQAYYAKASGNIGVLPLNLLKV